MNPKITLLLITPFRFQFFKDVDGALLEAAGLLPFRFIKTRRLLESLTAPIEHKDAKLGKKVRNVGSESNLATDSDIEHGNSSTEICKRLCCFFQSCVFHNLEKIKKI